MKNMKKGNILRLLILIVGLTLVVASISVSIAYILIRSNEITNTFIPAEMSCKVIETETTAGDIVTKTSVKAQNTGNIEAYIRVRVVTYWEDSKGNPVAIASPINQFKADNSGTWKYNNTDWIYDEANQTFYHKAPVNAGQQTAELLNNSIQLKIDEVVQENVTFTYHPVVEFIVEGIQSAPGTAAVEAWRVELDANGNITAKKQ